MPAELSVREAERVDSTRVTPSLLDRWWNTPRPETATDIATGLALLLVGVLVYLISDLRLWLTFAPLTAVEAAGRRTEMREWTIGIGIGAVVVFFGAVVRRAAFTAAMHFMAACVVGLMLLPNPPASAASAPLPSYHQPCSSGEHDCH